MKRNKTTTAPFARGVFAPAFGYDLPLFGSVDRGGDVEMGNGVCQGI